MKFGGINMLNVQRRKARTKVGHPAKIIVKEAATQGCIVDDLTTLGACLRLGVGAAEKLPPNFDLTFDNCHTFWSCRVIWRSKNGERVGVSWKNS
jgi:hypothetical protein